MKNTLLYLGTFFMAIGLVKFLLALIVKEKEKQAE